MSNSTCSCPPIEDPPVLGHERQWWLIAAYALDLILVFALAFFFRLHVLRRKRRPGSNSSGGSSEEIRLANTIIPAFQIAKGGKAGAVPHHPIAI